MEKHKLTKRKADELLDNVLAHADAFIVENASGDKVIFVKYYGERLAQISGNIGGVWERAVRIENEDGHIKMLRYLLAVAIDNAMGEGGEVFGDTLFEKVAFTTFGGHTIFAYIEKEEPRT